VGVEHWFLGNLGFLLFFFLFVTQYFFLRVLKKMVFRYLTFSLPFVVERRGLFSEEEVRAAVLRGEQVFVGPYSKYSFSLDSVPTDLLPHVLRQLATTFPTIPLSRFKLCGVCITFAGNLCFTTDDSPVRESARYNGSLYWKTSAEQILAPIDALVCARPGFPPVLSEDQICINHWLSQPCRLDTLTELGFRFFGFRYCGFLKPQFTFRKPDCPEGVVRYVFGFLTFTLQFILVE
jgi:hypothetical protein